ncbi:MAG TPA: Rieske 2Fe-2S domain-containing protein [Nocardioides sp.]|nr:Rieske 2Fe-2S domain-containing protein [Nocardioides sp.]
MTAPLSRRRALAGAATVGVGVPLLAACGDDGAGTAEDPATSEPTSSAPADPATTETASGATRQAPAGGGLVAVADVPVGGGVVLADEELVVTQPAAGEFKAFSAICTHQSCLVTSVSDNTISCPCHGSTFSAEDGSVTGGPAPSALSAVAVEVSGDQVVKG